MRFVFTKEQDEFRREVKDFVAAEMAAGSFAADSAGLVARESREFSAKMAQQGWIGFTWPKEFFGQGRSYVDKMILNEELMKYQAPIGYHFLADRQIGPSLIKFGTPWQQETFLPRIAKGEAQFCLLFSEPDAGSDLAGVSTTAVQEGDVFVINGQKIWTSEAHLSDYGWLLAKTEFDPSVSRHRACSEFIIDLKSPGVTVRPIINSAGAHSFNEVFFDDVRIEKRYLVGTKNQGFKQIMAQMDYERAGMERLLQNYPIFDLLKKHVQELGEDDKKGGFYAWVKDQMAQLEIEYNIGRLFVYKNAWSIDQGKQATIPAALTKAFCTQLEQRLNNIATQILGPVSQIRTGTEWAPFSVDLAACYLWGPSYTLQGGSTEILKNIIAQRGLGLPRA
jgi:alkylation response protein AidB-like acyl-CoA dehydrogenase